MPNLSYLKALNRAIGDEMDRDPDVCVFGEDVGVAVTNATAGLRKRFGPDRVLDTPISEQAFTGFATGAAMAGLRPLIEFQIPALLFLVFEQIANQAHKFSLMTGGQTRVPVTYLLPGSGSRASWAGQHSDHPYSLFAHVGVKTVVPATPSDAYGLLASAIRDDDPVVVFAPAGALGVREDLDFARLVPVPLGVGRIHRSGTDVTVVAVGHLVHDALAVAEELAGSVSVEVFDPRSLFPFDWSGLAASLERTGRLVVVDDSNRTCGIGAEIIATAAEEMRLIAPPRRVTRPDGAVLPFARELDLACQPTRTQLGPPSRKRSEPDERTPAPTDHNTCTGSRTDTRTYTRTDTPQGAQSDGIYIRARLAADPGLGAGNVLHKLFEHGADPDGPGAAFDVPVDGYPAGHELTLGQLRERVAARAAWWHGQGIGPRDPVAVYVSSSADCLLNFLALTWLGAIPALMNQYIPGDIAAEYIRRLRGVGLLTDPEHRARLAGEDLGVRLDADAAQAGTGDPAQAPAPYRHHADDPIAITHSSGTTRMPTSVVHSNTSLFAATRLFRLAAPRARGTARILSALPAAHAAGISALNLALRNRSELLFLSTQNDGAAVLDAIERWRPTGVLGFAATWAQLARHDLGSRDLESVSLWFNTGDCAHEPHIRHLVAAGSRETVTREGVRRVPGSSFVDGLGSTEMGHSAFHITHSAGTERYGRCVGVPHGFAEVALLDLATGREVPVGEVGHFGLKAPTLAPGYWNDSGATYRNRLNGYYLTGDLLYRDEEGYYYHVDRAVDAVDLGGGEWLYTAMSEERILAACPDVHDCTVVSLEAGGTVVTDVLLALHPTADPDLDRTPAVRAALTDAAAATLRRVVAISEEALIIGPTGKVRKFLMRQRHLAELAVVRMGGQENRAVPVHEPAERVAVHFAGDGAGVDELSWGMWEIWHAMVRQHTSLHIGGRTALPAGTTVADVAEELRYLMGRFPSMRTLLRFDAAGWPTQELFGSGSMALEVYDTGDADPEEVASAVEEHYRSTNFDYAAEWPVRMAVVRRDGLLTHLVSIMSHLVADAVGGAIMLREVQQRSTAPVTGLQQLEQAAWQRSPAGQRQSDKALRHWERALRTIPARRFPASADPRTPRYWTAEFHSPALRLAVPLIAERTGAETGTVLLTLYAVALRRISGADPVVVRPVINNRFRSDLSDVVCMVAQGGISVLNVGDGTVDEAVELTRRGVLATYKHAYFHPERLRELVARVSAERGEAVDVQCCLNNRTMHRKPEEGAAPGSEELAQQLRKARTDGVFRWIRRTEDPGNALYVSFDDAPDGLLLEIQTDTHYLSSGDAEALALGIEAVAVETALDPGTLTGAPSGAGQSSAGASGQDAGRFAGQPR